MEMKQLLTPETCYLHLIDVQESLMRQVQAREQVIANIKLVLRCADILGIRVVANTQYRKGLGLYVPELEELVAEIPRPDKVEFNGFANQETRQLVEQMPREVNSVILMGVETHICIYQTAIGAMALGLRPWIVSDGVSSRRQEHHEAGLTRLANVGAAVGPAEMLIYELLGRAGTEKFKKILPLIIQQSEFNI